MQRSSFNQMAIRFVRCAACGHFLCPSVKHHTISAR
nr:MAG TPA: Protein of unknown function (DUF678) [Caudoviricetes sp.]